MKAIRVHEFGAPEVMRLEEVPDPQPGPGQVVVRVHAAGVNALDTYIRAGMALSPPLPYTPGFDAAGVVESVGEGVSRVKVGDRVYAALQGKDADWRMNNSSYAEFALYQEYQVHPLPKQISFAQGAAVPSPYSSAYFSLFQVAKAVPGEVVLIHGASGGVGIPAVQMARAAGLTVIGTASSERGQRLVADEGAHHVLDHSSSDYLKQAIELTGGRGVDIVLEMIANVNLVKDLSILAYGGRVVVIGSKGKIEIDPSDLIWRAASIIGLNLFNLSAQELLSIHAVIVAGLENGTLRPIVGQEMPLADAARAHHAVEESGAYGKIALLP